MSSAKVSLSKVLTTSMTSSSQPSATKTLLAAAGENNEQSGGQGQPSEHQMGPFCFIMGAGRAPSDNDTPWFVMGAIAVGAALHQVAAPWVNLRAQKKLASSEHGILTVLTGLSVVAEQGSETLEAAGTVKG
eukprot:7864-Amphidinium_carterae.2